MRRISRDHPKFEVIRLLDRFARARGESIRDHSHQGEFLADLERHLRQNRDNNTLIHGLRVQAMFAYVASALGNCLIIKEEDAGEVFASDPDLCAPDFRIVTLHATEILVEVKNHRPVDASAPYRLRGDYLARLRRYAGYFQREVYIAVYWSQWKLWSLVNANRLDVKEGVCQLSLPEALKLNEMSLLGDCVIGTVPPLALSLLSDPEQPRALGSNGQVEFAIGEANLLAGGQVLEEEIEKKIAWFLINYGDWQIVQTPAEVADGKLIGVSFEARPEHRSNPDERFELLGTMSQMVARQYNDLTAENGGVDLLTPGQGPAELGVIIPRDYNGRSLPLWRFVVSPSST